MHLDKLSLLHSGPSPSPVSISKALVGTANGINAAQTRKQRNTHLTAHQHSQLQNKGKDKTKCNLNLPLTLGRVPIDDPSVDHLSFMMVSTFVQLVIVLMQVRVRRVMRRMATAVGRMGPVRMAVVRVMAERVRRMRLVHGVPRLWRLLGRSVAVAIVGEAAFVVRPRTTPVAVRGQDGGGFLGLS